LSHTWRYAGEQPGQPGLALFKRQWSEILAIQLDQIEGEKDRIHVVPFVEGWPHNGNPACCLA